MGPDGLRCAGGAKVSGQRCASRDIRFIDALGSPFCAHHGDQGVSPVLAFPAADDALEAAPVSLTVRETGRPSEAPETAASDVPEASFQRVVPASRATRETGRGFEAPESDALELPFEATQPVEELHQPVEGQEGQLVRGQATCAGTNADGSPCKQSHDLGYIDAHSFRFCRHHSAQGHPPVQHHSEFVNADGTPRAPERPKCSGRTKAGEPCGRIVLSHEYEGKLFCSQHAPAGATLLRWDPRRFPLCEGLLADGRTRCTRTALEQVEVSPGVYRGACRKHRDHWQTHQTLVLPKSERRRKRMPAVVVPEEVVEEGGEALVAEPLAPRERPTDLRQALQETAESAYGEIEAALRSAIRSASKTTKVACPKCRHAFALQVRDWNAVIRASSELLDRVVSKPSSTPVEPEVEMPMIPEEVSKLSNAELAQLLSYARPAPHSLPPEAKFRSLKAEIEETLDTVARWEEGHDVSRRELQRASLRLTYWKEMAALFVPLLGVSLDLDPEEARK